MVENICNSPEPFHNNTQLNLDFVLTYKQWSAFSAVGKSTTIHVLFNNLKLGAIALTSDDGRMPFGC